MGARLRSRGRTTALHGNGSMMFDWQCINFTAQPVISTSGTNFLSLFHVYLLCVEQSGSVLYYSKF